MGPTTLPTSLPIPGQTHTAADQNITLFQSYSLRPDGQLPTVQQGDTDEPRK